VRALGTPHRFTPYIIAACRQNGIAPVSPYLQHSRSGWAKQQSISRCRRAPGCRVTWGTRGVSSTAETVLLLAELLEEVPPEFTQVTVKLEAPAVSVKLEVEAVVTPELTMLIAAACQEEQSIGPVTPLIVADALVNVTDAKLASGSTSEVSEADTGASTIHSADDRWACGALWYVVKESLAWLASVIVNWNWSAWAPWVR